MFSLHFKHDVWAEASRLLLLKRQNLETAYRQNQKALESESKSTAGDKHETGRAMIQLELEKLGSQFAQVDRDIATLNQLEPRSIHTSIRSGSLVKLKNGVFYLSVGLGELKHNGFKVYCLTPASPFGQVLLGKKANDQITFRNNLFKIEDLI